MKTKLILFSFLMFFGTACQNAPRNNADTPTEKMTEMSDMEVMADMDVYDDIEIPEDIPPSPPPPPPPPPVPQQQQVLPEPQTTSRKIIRTADYQYQVKEVEKSTTFIRNTTKTFDGFITQMNQRTDSYAIRNEFTIKVPADQFEALLEALLQDAIFVNHKRINSEDVTSQFVDIEARLSTKKAVRDRYMDILRTKTGNVRDVLDAEDRIRRIQEEIEAKEAQLRHLSGQVKYSTIHLSIYQELEYRNEPKVYKESFWVKMSKSLGAGWQAFLAIILFLVRIWPVLIVAGLVIWQRKRIFRRRK